MTTPQTRARRLAPAGLLAILLAGCGASDAGPDDPLLSGDDAKADDADGPVGPRSTLDAPIPPAWDALRPAVGEATGLPLAVSNNPEHVYSRGVLFDTHPDADIPTRGPGAPAPTWAVGGGPDTSADQGCAPGRYRELGIYLAHILDRSVPGPRRISVLVDVDAPATLRWRGSVGSTLWSHFGAPATRRTDWLGAEIAKSFFFGAAPEETAAAEPGVPVAIAAAEVDANGLIEGRLELTADGGCARVRVVAHGAGGASPELARWADGDVKWPGWLDGRGYGRAAGVYEADTWIGAEAVGLLEVGRTVGRALLTADQSMRASGRLADSSEILFGNYGALHVQRLVLQNRTDRCVVAGVDLAAYADRGAASAPRAPTAAYYDATAGQYMPSMVWNGPAAVRVDDGPRTIHHAVLYPNPTDRDRAAPEAAMGSLRARLAETRLLPGAEATVDIELPVPGYILAPIGLLVTPVSCSDDDG